MQQQGMFGPTPEELQFALTQQQNDADQQRAMQWGRQTFDQQVSSAAYGGAQMVGRGIEGALRGGGILPEDPRLAEAKRLMTVKQKIMSSGIDPQDIDNFYPEMIKQLYQGGLIDKALEVEKQYQTISTQQDAIQARKDAAENKKKEDAMPGYRYLAPLVAGLKEKPENAALVQAYANSITPVTPTGNIEILKQLETKIAGVKLKHVGEDGPTGLPAWQVEDGSEPAFYRDAQGNKVIIKSGLRPKNTTDVRVGGATIKQAEDLGQIRGQHLAETKPYDEILRGTSQSLGLAKLAEIGNPTATEAFRNSIAKTFRSDGQVAQAEVNRLINAGALDTRIANGFLRFFAGEITQETINDAKATIQAMRSWATKQRDTIKRERAEGYAGRLTPQEIKFVTGGAEGVDEAPTPTNPVEAAKAELAKRQGKN